MTVPILYVDFNEMLAPDLVLLSAGDAKKAYDGTVVVLREGMEVEVYMDDPDIDGTPDNLVATGRVEANVDTTWSGRVKWCCRIDAQGIRRRAVL